MTTAKQFNPLQHETPRIDLDALGSLVTSLRKRRADWEQIVIVEVGSWVGQSALELAKPGCVVHCIDHWRGNEHDRLGAIATEHGAEHVFHTFCDNVGAKLWSQIIPHRGDSLEWAAKWMIPADLIFIDAEHTYEACKADTDAWWPHVKPGGFMAWHDYGAFHGVTLAVEQFGMDDHLGTVAWKQKKF
jgi:hypothetical protein